MAVATTALVNLTTVKSELGISSSADDTYLERLINAASTYIDKYCNRTLSYSSAVVEKRPAYGTTYLRVSRPPIGSITSITYDGSTVSSTAYEVHNANAGVIYAINGSWIWTTGMIDGLIAGDNVPGFERKLYTITYAGGYVTQPQVDANALLTRTLPYEIEDAAIQIVTYRYRNRGTDPTISSESLMDYSVSYKVPGVVGTKTWLETMLPGAAAMLIPHRLAAFA